MSPTAAQPAAHPGDEAALTLYYDGGCPLCRREVAFYRRLDRRGRVAWLDVSEAAGAASCPLDREAALARLHARRRDGSLVSGAAVFVALWRELPGLRHVAPLAAWPPALALLERGYRGFLRIRPWLTGRRRAGL